eukprot:10151511-Ditylum_brightwellii.AAC.1
MLSNYKVTNQDAKTREKKREEEKTRFQGALSPKGEAAPQDKNAMKDGGYTHAFSSKTHVWTTLRIKEGKGIYFNKYNIKIREETRSTTTTRVPVMDASGGLFVMIAAAGIHDHNNRTVLQDEAIEVENQSNSNEDSDNDDDSDEESDEESVNPRVH